MICTRIFGFEVESDIELPCNPALAAHCPQKGFQGTLRIAFRPRPDWSFERVVPLGRRFWGSAYDVGDGVFVSTRSGVSFYFLGNGARVEVHFNRQDALQRAQAGVWLANMGMAICHLLRGSIPLHGASIESNGQLVGLMAASGTGKSTLLWRLLDAGALFCADDLLPIHFENTGAVATPSISLHGKLSGAALTSRGLQTVDFAEIAPSADEFWVPLDAKRRTFEARRPAALFVLSPFVASETAPQDAPLFARRHLGADAVSLLLGQTHGLWATCGLLDTKILMGRFVQIAREIPVFTLHYARDFAVLPLVQSALAEILAAPSFSSFPS